MEDIYSFIDKNHKLFVEIRRDLHALAEISLKEYNTQQFICNFLSNLGIEYKKVADTGVYVLIKGENSGKTLALRADMDGLPIKEDTGLDFSSKGYASHSCGHDAHMTFLLSIAYVIKKSNYKFNGNLVLLFQPAEEKYGGAERMIAEGVLENPKVDAIIGTHVWALPCGTIASKSGAVMACPDIFKIRVYGKAGHGAEPHNSINPIIPMANIISSINDIKSAYIDARHPLIITPCIINAGSSYNIIPRDCYLEGTIRSYDDEIRKEAISKLEIMCKNIAAAYGASCDFEIVTAYPATFNDEKLATWAYDKLKDEFKNNTIISDILPVMTGEDFSYYGKYIPSLFLWIGILNPENNCIYDLHNPKFNIDENVFSFGFKALMCLVNDFYKN